jgi:Tol biopolymer transport system component
VENYTSFPVYALAWSPDGKRVALASDYSVTVRDAVSGQVLVTYPRNPPPGGQPSYIVAWSPDGKTIASAGRMHAVQFWEAATGRPLHYFPALAQAIAAAWSPDGRYLAYMVEQNPMAYEDQLRPVQIIVREVSTAREVLSLAGNFGIGMRQASTLIFPHSLA